MGGSGGGAQTSWGFFRIRSFVMIHKNAKLNADSEGGKLLAHSEDRKDLGDS